MKLNNIFYKTILIIFFLCLGLAITSFIWTAINSNIYIDLSNKGFLDFYNNYQSVVVLMGIGITLLTLLATFGRINQTDKQLQFSNFYTHREEFIKTFSDHHYIKEISKANEYEPQVLLSELYSLFYYKTYKNFSPRINEEFLQTLEGFYNNIKKSIVNKSAGELKTLDSKGIREIRKKIPNEILIYIYRFSQYIQKQLVSSDDLREYMKYEKEKSKIVNSFEFIMLHDVLYSIKLIILLMSYDGIIKEPLYYLSENIHVYRMELNLPFDIYNEL